MRVASRCEPTEEAQHRLAGVAVAVVVVILPSVAEYRDERVCLSVCVFVREHISGTACAVLSNYRACYLWLRLGFCLATLQYVIYIRFYR